MAQAGDLSKRSIRGQDGPLEPTSRILGIDPGLNVTGYALVLDGRPRRSLVEAGVIRPAGDGELGRRLDELYREVMELLESHRPHAVALEELYSHYKRPITAIKMGHARGVICLAAARCQVPVVGYAATHVKKMLTGNGRAPKSQMQQAVCREFGLLRPPEPHDVADAMAIALCHAFADQVQSNLEGKL